MPPAALPPATSDAALKGKAMGGGGGIKIERCRDTNSNRIAPRNGGGGRGGGGVDITHRGDTAERENTLQQQASRRDHLETPNPNHRKMQKIKIPACDVPFIDKVSLS